MSEVECYALNFVSNFVTFSSIFSSLTGLSIKPLLTLVVLFFLQIILLLIILGNSARFYRQFDICWIVSITYKLFIADIIFNLFYVSVNIFTVFYFAECNQAK